MIKVLRLDTHFHFSILDSSISMNFSGPLIFFIWVSIYLLKTSVTNRYQSLTDGMMKNMPIFLRIESNVEPWKKLICHPQNSGNLKVSAGKIKVTSYGLSLPEAIWMTNNAIHARPKQFVLKDYNDQDHIFQNFMHFNVEVICEQKLAVKSSKRLFTLFSQTIYKKKLCFDCQED